MIVFIMRAMAAPIRGEERNYRELPPCLHTEPELGGVRRWRASRGEVKFLRLVTVSETNFNIDLAAR